MPASELTLLYLPAAVGLGALHALEPGHAKTMIAAYLIGVKGTWRDALVLGLSAAATHSLVVVALAVGAVLLGRQVAPEAAGRWLAIASAVVVTVIGAWMTWRRWRSHHRRHHHDHPHDPGHHHHHDDEDAHARAHAAQLPPEVRSGEHPGLWSILAFGAAGGLIPCPASISVMLLALSVGQVATGLLLVGGFSLGLALTMVGVGLAVVVGWRHLGTGRLGWLSRHSTVISSAVITLSGLVALAVALGGPGH